MTVLFYTYKELIENIINITEHTNLLALNASIEAARGGAQVQAMRSLLIKDTTREERMKIVAEALAVCGGACDFCNGCDNIGGGSVDSLYQPYIDGEKELREINMEYNRSMVR